MIVYHQSKADFLDDVLTNAIDSIILNLVQEKLSHGTGKSEVASWKHSLQSMALVLSDRGISDDCGVCIEYKLPHSGKRIDFILTGQDAAGREHVIIVELKQWQQAQLTTKDAIVATYLNGAVREVTHPSYQAWSYAALLEGFNQTVQDENIQLHPCAYLHNYTDDGVLTDPFYAHHVANAPLFFQPDAKPFRAFIKQFLQAGDSQRVMERIDWGPLRPSKSLADQLASMLQGNQDFVMVDDQKLVYETALQLAQASSADHKNVLIVEGGPGTGKSVVAVNLLVALTQQQKLAQYVTKNAAPRDVYESKLTGTMRKSAISNFFIGSGAFTNTAANTFDGLVVDEGHRLNEKSGLYGNLGDNQIMELIRAAKASVFFIDEKQRVTLKDIGTKAAIIGWAQDQGATVHELSLSSQFRCNGSNDYLTWLDEVLQLPAAPDATPLQGLGYDFQVVDGPHELREMIVAKNQERNKARLVAGYCWPWPSKKDPKAFDVVLPEQDFAIRWNLTVDGGLWILNPDSVQEIGCIHTCQGLEVDYIGVIVGPDLVVRNGTVITDAKRRASSDKSVFGHKKLALADPQGTAALLDDLIKNTYRTLMTRGLKGCYVYFTDAETQAYFRSQVAAISPSVN